MMTEAEARKEAAYIAGQNAGFANKPAYSVCPFDQASQGGEFFAFLDGHEDGQDMYRREACASAPATTCIETIGGDPETALRLSFQIKVF